jgi:hypothetical protein
MDSRDKNREFTANGRDIIIKNKKREKSCIPIDGAIPADRNYVHKEAVKENNARVYV